MRIVVAGSGWDPPNYIWVVKGKSQALTITLLIFSCIFVFCFLGRQREIQQKGRGANENNKYLSHLSSLNFAAT
jgi:hypothetical protein